MQLCEHFYPEGVTVAVTHVDGKIRIRVYNNGKRGSVLGEPAQPILKHGPEVVRKQKMLRIRDDMVNLIRNVPGNAFSFYTRLGLAQGGVRGSQEYKEIVLEGLIKCGAVSKHNLINPVGRKTHELYVDEEVAQSMGLPSGNDGV